MRLIEDAPAILETQTLLNVPSIVERVDVVIFQISGKEDGILVRKTSFYFI